MHTITTKYRGSFATFRTDVHVRGNPRAFERFHGLARGDSTWRGYRSFRAEHIRVRRDRRIRAVSREQLGNRTARVHVRRLHLEHSTRCAASDDWKADVCITRELYEKLAGNSVASSSPASCSFVHRTTAVKVPPWLLPVSLLINSVG